MNIQRFTAPTTREALIKVRQALGDDAVILANRDTPDGVEILASLEQALDDSLQAFANQQTTVSPAVIAEQAPPVVVMPEPSEPAQQHTPPVAVATSPELSPAFTPTTLVASPSQATAPEPTASAPTTTNSSSKKHKSKSATQAAPVKTRTEPVSVADNHIQTITSDAANPVVVAENTVSTEAATEKPEQELNQVMSEIRAMRGSLQAQLNSIETPEPRKNPLRSTLFKQLFSLGFSTSLARYLAHNVPKHLEPEQALMWAKAALIHNLYTLENESDILNQGGVFAIVGPTGVGKTTTTAKLAARFVLRHGANQLALINTDNYRIGAPEQVKIYGKILGVSVHAVHNSEELKQTLDQLKDKRCILIDTVGMSQHDQQLAEQIAMLSRGEQNVKRILCLNATNSVATLNEVINVHAGDTLCGCILTKLDEAGSICNVLNVVLRHKLKILYTAVGQRVPEDLEIGSGKQLIELALHQALISSPAEKPVNPVSTESKPDSEATTQTEVADAETEAETTADVTHIKTTPEVEPAEDELEKIMSEIRAMRGSLEAQLSALNSNEPRKHPAKSNLFKQLFSLGFSTSLSRYLAHHVPEDLQPEQALLWAKKALIHNLKTLDDEADILNQGGIFAIVGPTGVGKTTTTAKLAARFVLRHGSNKFALINTDSYRIGAPEQVRIYGKILGVSVYPVRNNEELKQTLETLKDKHCVLIDTVGMSQRDQQLAEQIAMLSRSDQKVNRILCLNTTNSIETLNEVIEVYAGNDPCGCILTKLDEAGSICNALDVVLRHKLRVLYTAVGQKVPEDLEIANASQLIEQAFQHSLAKNTAKLKDEELELILEDEDELEEELGLDLPNKATDNNPSTPDQKPELTDPNQESLK